MKKILALLLVAILGVTVLAGCSAEEFKQGFKDGMKDFGEGFVEGWEEEGKDKNDTDIDIPNTDKETDEEKDEFDEEHDEAIDGDNCDTDGDYELNYQKDNAAVTAGFTLNLENFTATKIDENLVEVHNRSAEKIGEIFIGTIMTGTSKGVTYETFENFSVNSEEEWVGYKVTDGNTVSYILTTNNSMKNAKATLNIMSENLDDVENIVSNLEIHTWMSASFGA